MSCINAKVNKAYTSPQLEVVRKDFLEQYDVALRSLKLSCVITDVFPDKNLFVSRVNNAANINVSVLCSIGILDRTHELFYVREGVFLLSDGKKLKVLKYELSE